jgi:hypothetical protein
LDIVELGKRPAGAGWAEILELVPCLADQIGTISEKQNAPELRMLQEPMAEHAGGVGLAGAGRHLDHRPRLVIGAARASRFDGVDLAFAQALVRERRHRGCRLAQIVIGSEPSPQGLRAVKEENAARPRRRVGMIAKQDLSAGR